MQRLFQQPGLPVSPWFIPFVVCVLSKMILFAFEADGTKTREACRPRHRNAEKHLHLFSKIYIAALFFYLFGPTTSSCHLTSMIAQRKSTLQWWGLCLVDLFLCLSWQHALSYLFIITDSEDLKPLWFHSHSQDHFFLRTLSAVNSFLATLADFYLPRFS